LNQTAELAVRYLETLDERGVAPTPEALAGLSELNQALQDDPQDPLAAPTRPRKERTNLSLNCRLRLFTTQSPPAKLRRQFIERVDPTDFAVEAALELVLFYDLVGGEEIRRAMASTGVAEARRGNWLAS
jgi:hypothetical protein